MFLLSGVLALVAILPLVACRILGGVGFLGGVCWPRVAHCILGGVGVLAALPPVWRVVASSGLVLESLRVVELPQA